MRVEEFAALFRYDTRTVRERLLSTLTPGRHFNKMPGARRIIVNVTNVCADMGLPHANWNVGDFLLAEEVATLLGYDVRTIRDAYIGSGRWVQRTHYFRMPSATVDSRKLLFCWPLLCELIGIQAPPATLSVPSTEHDREAASGGCLPRPSEHVDPEPEHDIPRVRTPHFSLCAAKWVLEHTVEYSSSAKNQIAAMMDKHLLPLFGDLEIGEITQADLHNAMLVIERQSGRTHVKLGWSVLGQIFAKASALYCFPSPMEPGSSPPRSRRTARIMFLTDAIRLIHAASDQHRPYFTTRLFSGLTNEEAHHLRWHNVDFNTGRILVTESLISGEWRSLNETEGRRSVPMSAVVARALRQQMGLSHRSTGINLVFPSDSLRPLDPAAFSARVFEPLLRQVGLSGFTLRDLKNTAPVMWLAAGHTPQEVSDWLGHFSPSEVQTLYGPSAYTQSEFSPMDRFIAANLGQQAQFLLGLAA